MEQRLKRCPFCGEKVFPFFLGETDWKGRQKGFIAIQCPSCKVTVTHTDIYYYGPEIEIPLEETKGFEKLKAIWNKRIRK